MLKKFKMPRLADKQNAAAEALKPEKKVKPKRPKKKKKVKPKKKR